jgi:hypothetical protein
MQLPATVYSALVITTAPFLESFKSLHGAVRGGAL